MTITELIIAALAVWQAVEIWHHSSLFAGWRAWVETFDDWMARDLLGCPFCLSNWIAWLMTPIVVHYAWWMQTWTPREGNSELLVMTCDLLQKVAQVGWLFIHGLAVARLANLGNDVTHAMCRTPRHNRLEFPEEDNDPGTTEATPDVRRGDLREAPPDDSAVAGGPP